MYCGSWVPREMWFLYHTAFNGSYPFCILKTENLRKSLRIWCSNKWNLKTAGTRSIKTFIFLEYPHEKNEKRGLNHSWALRTTTERSGVLRSVFEKSGSWSFGLCFVLRPFSHISNMKNWSRLNGLPQKDNSLLDKKEKGNSTFSKELVPRLDFEDGEKWESSRGQDWRWYSGFQNFPRSNWTHFDFFDKTRNSDFLCKVNFSLRMSVRVQNFVVTSGLSKCSMRVPIYRPREIKFEI